MFVKTPEELLNNLKWVFDQCDKRGVKLKRSKCKLFAREVEFLGFLISHNKISPVPNKYDPVALKQPKNKKEVLSVLGAFNHYSRFIDKYSEKV